jgi:hypothetical protein
MGYLIAKKGQEAGGQVELLVREEQVVREDGEEMVLV